MMYGGSTWDGSGSARPEISFLFIFKIDFSHPIFVAFFEFLVSPQQITATTEQGWAPRPAGTPPRGEGGFPAPPRTVGRGGVPRPDPPRKNDQNRGEVAGQNKGLYLNFLKKRKLMMEQYYNTE